MTSVLDGCELLIVEMRGGALPMDDGVFNKR